MREIKFKAYHNASKKMFDWSDFSINGRNNCIIHFNDGVFETTKGGHNNVVLLQFTGLTDKNGNEIYEGDIIGGYPHGTVEVSWNNQNALFEAKWDEQQFDEYGSPIFVENSSLLANELSNCGDAWQVIGNIYQNPELLK